MKQHDKTGPDGVSRRNLLGMISTGAVGATLASTAMAGGAQAAPGGGPRRHRGPTQGPLNILFVFTDQERYFHQLPRGLSLPGHERLWRHGTTFTNHYIGAVMCTSSRSIMMTGLQTADNGMFENADMPYVPDMDTKIPTIGHMMRKAGYYSAYKGKWHLTKSFDQHEPTRLFTPEMDAYGFSDYASPGDVVGHTLGGYEFDHLIGGSVITWLRRRGMELKAKGQPWALTTSLVNPHDIMYFNTDAPGTKTQDNGKLLKHVATAPDVPFYKHHWDVPLSATNGEAMRSSTRPGAHAEYQDAWDALLGHVPNEAERWMRFNDFYFNSIRAVDAQLMNIFNELDTLGLTDRTIIVFTADHGEMGGAHGGLRGKGPFAYEENVHVPMIIVHPDVNGGQSTNALTSHIDIAPTLLSMAGAGARTSELAGRDLPGKDFSSLLGARNASVNQIRESVLFACSGIAPTDASFVKAMADAITSGRGADSVKAAGIKPDLRKRGTVRTAFDGRYKYSRYFSPMQHNRPRTLDQIYANNDVELFDLATDPNETRNLGARKGDNAELVLAQNEKLDRVVAAEIGVDNGRELPHFEGVNWSLPMNGLD